MNLVNSERTDRGLPAYSPQSQLREAARVHAADMACNHFGGHTGSDGSSVYDRVVAQGYSPTGWVGENWMATLSGPQAAFNWWMGSEPHRNNILNSFYTEFGVGYIQSPGSDYGEYYVIVFARPQ